MEKSQTSTILKYLCHCYSNVAFRPQQLCVFSLHTSAPRLRMYHAFLVTYSKTNKFNNRKSSGTKSLAYSMVSKLHLNVF